jgi:hypothetical protein
VSRYAQLRRRLAPIAFFGAIALLAHETCNKQERTAATIVLDYGAATPDVQAVAAELWMDGGEVARFQRTALDGLSIGPSRFETTVPASDGELRLEIDLKNGDRRSLRRQIHVPDGATVTVRLDHDLR